MELGVKALVESSLLKSRDEIRLTARIVDPFHKNRIIASHEIKKSVSEVSKVPNELSLAVIKSVNEAITPAEEFRLTSGREVLPEAYDFYAKGHKFFSADRVAEAIESYEKAIQIDPSFAPAYASLGEMLINAGANNVLPAKDAYPKAEKAILKALELDENSANAHSALASLLELNGNYKGAETEFTKAFEIAPGNPSIMVNYYEYLVWTKGEFDEAIEGMKNVLARNPRNWIGIRKLPMYLLAAGRYLEGFDAAKKSASVDPILLYDSFAASALALMGRHEEAVSLAEKMRVSPEYQKDQLLDLYLRDHACVLALAGRLQKALEKLEELRSLLAARRVDPNFESACVYAALGDKDEAFLLLEQAHENQSGMMSAFRSNWWLHSLHDDPRFGELVKKMGLPEIQSASEER